MHDATLDRTTTGHGVVSAVAWDELRRLDAGVRFAPEFAGTRVPRLADLLAAAAGRSGVLIELKAEAERADLLVQRVLAAVAAADASSWVRLISFEPEKHKNDTVKAATPAPAAQDTSPAAMAARLWESPMAIRSKSNRFAFFPATTRAV